jgi:hypothetical protein
MPSNLAEVTEYGTLKALIPSWERSLRAGNKSPKTIRSPDLGLVAQHGRAVVRRAHHPEDQARSPYERQDT